MLNIKKLIASMFIALLILPSGSIAQAGGSSISLRISGSESTTYTGETIPNVLNLNVETYFLPSGNIDDIKIDDITVVCVGKDVLSRVDLSLGEKILATSNFDLKHDLYIAQLSDITMNNNADYNFRLNFAVKENIEIPQDIYCGIRNITLTDLNHAEVIFTGLQSGGFVNVEGNESSIIHIKAHPHGIFGLPFLRSFSN